MHNLDWLDGSRDEILTKLAETAVRGRHARLMQKQAIPSLQEVGNTISGYANSAKDYLSGAMPAVRNRASQLWDQAKGQVKGLPAEAIGGLGGAALGAGLGGLTSFGQDPEERHTGSNMLTGALAGGALGLGGTLAARHSGLMDQWKKPSPGAGSSAVGWEPSAAQPKPAPKPPTSITIDGKEVPASPASIAAAKADPVGFRQQYDAAQPSAVESIGHSGIEFAKEHPYVTTVAGADAGRGILRAAAGSRGSLSPEQLQNNISNLVGGKTKTMPAGVLEPDLKALNTIQSQAELQQALVRARAGQVPFPHRPDLRHISAETLQNIQATGGGRGGSATAALMDIVRPKNPGLAGTGWKMQPNGGIQQTGNLGVGALQRMGSSARPMGRAGKMLGRAGGYGTALAAPAIIDWIENRLSGNTAPQLRDALLNQ